MLRKVSCNSASDRQACRTCNMFVAWPGLSRKACLRMYYFGSCRCCVYAPPSGHKSHTTLSHTFFARSSSIYISAARNPFMDVSSKYIPFTHTHSHLLLMAHLSQTSSTHCSEFSHDEVMIDFYVRDSCHTNIQ